MDQEFIKKVSRSLMIIGIVTLIFNSLTWLIIQNNPIVNYFTFIGIAISVVILYVGIKRPIKVIAYFQIIGTYVIAFFSFLDDPGNLAGIFLSIINYILLSEYHILKKFWHKFAIITLYLIPTLLSILFLNRPFDQLPPIYLLTAFFSFFLYDFINHKKEKSFDAVNKSFDLLTRLEPLTNELLENSKVQQNLIIKQKAEIDQFKKFTSKVT